MLGDVGKHQVGGNRRDLEQPRFTPFALNVVFARVAKAAMALQAGLSRMPGGLGRQQFAHIGIVATGQPGGKTRGGPAQHQISRLDFGMRPGHRKLHCLVLANRPVKNAALVDIGGRSFGEPAPVADRLA